MINTDRIVPVTRTDLISLYAFIMGGPSRVAVISSDDADGNFHLTELPAGEYEYIFADEPVSTFDIDPTISELPPIYFVPAYDYAGFTANGEFVQTAGDEVDADGCTLYKAVAGVGGFEITKEGF